MITVERVSKSYHRAGAATQVLRNVSCSIPRGRFTFIVGPSGSGKSTLLYLLGALDAPDSGRILIDGAALDALTPVARDELRRRKVGFVFQNFNLLSNLNAVDNVLVPFLPTREVAAKRPAALALLERVGLGARVLHRPSELSGGEQQRVAIARAILKQPDLVLADEPTGELDSETGRAVFRLLRELQAELGTTVVVVTHDHRYIQADDLVLRIQDGQLAPAAPPAELH
jgi:putative ABC transport system ATP-binding protein